MTCYATTSMRRAALLLGLILVSCASAPPPNDGNAAIYNAWLTQHSHLEVTASGVIARDLGTRSGVSGTHEGFLLHLSGASGRGLTVRVEANVDFTGLMPIAAGEPVVVRGEYEFDSRGGVIHWTHRDPRGRHPDGYIQIQNKRYG